MITELKMAIFDLQENGGQIDDYRKIHNVFKEIESLKDEFKQMIDKYFSRYSKEELSSYKIEKRNGKANYDFKHIPEWVEKKSELIAIETKCKLAAQKSFENNNYSAIDLNTGEIIEKPSIIPAKVTYSNDIIVFK